MKRKKQTERGENMTSTEMTTKQETTLAIPALDEWGTQEVTSNDIIIPRILAMQGMSDMVTEGKAKFGEIRESLNEDILGNIDQPFEILPFKVEKIWRIETQDGKKLLRIDPIVSNPQSSDYNDDPSNMFEIVEKGEHFRKVKAYNFFLLIPSELEKGGVIPYMLQLKVTSIRAAKKLMTQMYTKNRAAKKSPAASIFDLSVGKQQNDHGTFVVFDVSVKRDSTKEEEATAFQWFKMLQGTAHKVHDVEEEVPF